MMRHPPPLTLTRTVRSVLKFVAVMVKEYTGTIVLRPYASGPSLSGGGGSDTKLRKTSMPLIVRVCGPLVTTSETGPLLKGGTALLEFAGLIVPTPAGML